ncbi:MAG: NAD(P)/FAD-dependent oxidoreductase [Candidatus Zixiibacteriota bacterium]
MSHKIAIIGAGPAGIAAAIQLKRYDQEPVIFESHQVGGLIYNAWKIANYPGFPNGVSGIDLASSMQRQLSSAGIVPRHEHVRLLDYDCVDDRFIIQTDHNEYNADYVIAATGTKPKKMDILESLDDTFKRNLYYEVAPILSVENRTIIIIGAGDIAFDYALNLSEKNRVIILNRSAHSNALPHLKSLVSITRHISYFENVDIVGVEGAGTGLSRLVVLGDGVTGPLEYDYILAAIGRLPRDEYFSPELLDKVDELRQSGRLYFAGDIKNGILRQVGIAVGDGLRAAMQIYYSLKENKSCV